MELQRDPKNTVRSLEGPWGHSSNMKVLHVPQINSRWGLIPLHSLQSHPASPIKHIKWLNFVQPTPEIPQEHRPKSRGTPSSAQQLKESSVYPKSSRDESWFLGFDSRGMPTFDKHLMKRFLSAIGMWEDLEFAAWSGIDNEMTWLERRSDFPAVTWMQARLSSHKIKESLNPLWIL